MLEPEKVENSPKIELWVGFNIGVSARFIPSGNSLLDSEAFRAVR